jgi:aryl-alcohol dehydrogenase-like predicted oxidoreductase
VEVEIFPQAVAENIAITAYRSLVQGLLTGKYRWGKPLPENTRGQTSAQIITWLSQFGESLDRFIAFAEEREITPATLAVAWVRHARPVTAPIIGVSSLPQLEEALDSFDYNLSDEDYRQVTYLFDTEVKEEGLQRFPGLKYNFPRLRRNLDLVQG